MKGDLFVSFMVFYQILKYMDVGEVGSMLSS